MDYYDQLAKRLAGHVAAKLGVAVTFSHWFEHKTGAKVPVFIVPAEMRERARAEGLEVV